MHVLLEFWNHPESFTRFAALLPWLISIIVFLGVFVLFIVYLIEHIKKINRYFRLLGICIVFLGAILAMIQVHVTTSNSRAQAEREKQLQSTIKSLESSLAAEKEAKEKEGQLKRTPPSVTVWLTMTNTPNSDPNLRRFTLFIRPHNLVPFEYDWKLFTKESRYLLPFVALKWAHVFPVPQTEIYHVSEDIPINDVIDNYIELLFDYRSIYMRKLALPGLKGRIRLQYKLSKDKHTLEPLQHSQ